MPFERWTRSGAGLAAQDEADLSPWEVEPSLLADLRLGAATQALEEGQPDLALVEAEQLLRRHPDDLLALGLVGRAAISVGDGDMAAAALARVVGEDEAGSEAWALYSLALTLGFRFDEGRGAAEHAIALDPTLAVAWLHLALAQERLGERLGARRAYARAATLAPGVLSGPRSWSEAAWALSLREARDRLSLSARVFYQRVPVCWRALPSLDELPGRPSGLSPFAGAFAVSPAPERDEMPAHVLLFRQNLARGAAERGQLTERIRVALQAQASGWMRGA